MPRCPYANSSLTLPCRRSDRVGSAALCLPAPPKGPEPVDSPAAEASDVKPVLQSRRSHLVPRVSPHSAAWDVRVCPRFDSVSVQQAGQLVFAASASKCWPKPALVPLGLPVASPRSVDRLASESIWSPEVPSRLSPAEASGRCGPNHSGRGLLGFAASVSFGVHPSRNLVESPLSTLLFP